MAEPTPRSFPQVIGAMLDAFSSRTGIRRLRTGDPILSLFEAAAGSDVRSSADVFRLQRGRDLDSAQGAELDRLGAEADRPRGQPRYALATLTFTDTTFQRVSTTVSAAQPAPIVGSGQIAVESAAAFPATGAVYVGRGTPLVEGPLPYSAKTNAGAYWVLTLTGTTTRFHNRGEAVVLAQGGNRVVAAGTVVATPTGPLAQPIQFQTTTDATIADGETTVQDVPARCTQRGAVGNVADGGLTAFPGAPPFVGAAVTNPLLASDGADVEDDETYRSSIRTAEANRVRGTDAAIEQAVVGVTGNDGAQCSAAQIVRRPGRPAALYVDDGSGYELTASGVGVEVLTEEAAGGELDFATVFRPIVQAELRSTQHAPYPLTDGYSVSVRVGGTTTTHVFTADQFAAVGAASAYEIAASINADPNLGWAARTAGRGADVVVYARTETDDEIELVSDSAGVFGFPAAPVLTTALYQNDVLLNKDGRPARLRGASFGAWGSLASPETLVVSVDGTPAQTYTFTDLDFASTVFTGLGNNSLAVWAAVLTARIPGLTAAVDGDALVLVSNRGTTAGAAVTVTGGTLADKQVVPPDTATGAPRDYAVSRGTGQIVLADVLATGDRLTLGSTATRGFAQTGALAPTDLATTATLWFAVDGAATVVPTGLTPATLVSATVTRPGEAAYEVAFEVVTADGAASPFGTTTAGDHFVVWDPGAPTTWRRPWRVSAQTHQANFDTFSHTRWRLLVEAPQAAVARFHHAAASIAATTGALPRALVCGGYTQSTPGTADITATGTRKGLGVTRHVEAYDANTLAWAGLAQLATARAHHTATVLQNGKVLVVGGYTHDGSTVASVEIYDPAADTWSAAASLPAARAEHTATLLNSGKVLVVGGTTDGNAALNTSLEYDPGANTWGNSQGLAVGHRGHSAVLLPAGAGSAGAEAGNVLIVGGNTTGSTRTNIAERYNTGTPGWVVKAGLPSTRAWFALAVTGTQQVLAFGDGEGSITNQATYATYNVTTNAWVGDTAIDAGTWRWADKRDGFAVNAGQVYAPAGTLGVSTHSGLGLTQIDSTCVDKTFTTGGGWVTSGGQTYGTMGVSRSACICLPLGAGYFVHGGLNRASKDVHSLSQDGTPIAEHEVFNGTLPAAIVATNRVLPLGGVTVVRTVDALHRGTVAAASQYTAATLAEAITVPGLTAETYRTTRLRVRTNTYGDGDVLVAGNDSTAVVPLAPGAGAASGLATYGSAVSAQDTGTPHNFRVYPLWGVGTPDAGTAYKTFLADDSPPPPSGALVGLRRAPAGLNPVYWQVDFTAGTDRLRPQYADARGQAWGIHSTADETDRLRVSLRAAPVPATGDHAPVVAARPYALTPRDRLTVEIDGLPSRRFDLSAGRRVAPQGTTYAATNTYRDADNGGAILQRSFGPTYDFSDFAVYMRARVLSHPADATKRVLWRYYRHGAEGQLVAVRYAYPSAAGAAPTLRTTVDQGFVTDQAGGAVTAFADIVLGSGAAKVAHRLAATSRIGLARCNQTSGVWDVYVLAGFEVTSASRANGAAQTNFTVQVPNDGTVAHGPQATGILAGDVVWFEAAAPSGVLSSGSFVVASVGAIDGAGHVVISAPAGALNDGTAGLTLTNPGTLSAAPTGESAFDPSIAAGDLLALGSNPAVLPAAYTTAGTMRIAATGPRFLRCRGVDPTGAGAQTTPVWAAVVSPAVVVAAFGAPATSAAGLVAAVGAAGVVAGTVTGAGSGVVTQATWDELSSVTAAYQLTDGLNWVQSTGFPVLTTDDTTLTFKAPVAAGLATNSDWSNEDVRLVPVTAANVAQWLSTPAATGLWTAAEIALARGGRAVQIASLTPGSGGSVDVQGGLMSAAGAAVVGATRLPAAVFPRAATCLVTVRTGDADGLTGDAWVRVQAADGAPKAPWWNGTTIINTVESSGVWTPANLNSIGGSDHTTPYAILGDADGVRIVVERVGPYTAIRASRLANYDLLTTCVEGGYVCVQPPLVPRTDLPPVAGANRGTFRVVRFTIDGDESVVWVVNAGAVEELSVARLTSLSPDSMVAGDIWNVSTNAFGAANRRAFRVTEVGAFVLGSSQYQVRTFRTSGSPVPVTAPVTFGVDQGSLALVEGEPYFGVKKILTITPAATAGYTEIQLDTADAYGRISASTGATLVALDKLAYPAGAQTGVDGYRRATGLVGAANQVVYGDRQDEAAFPGFAAEGAEIVVQGAPVQRVRLGLTVRVRGTPTQVTRDRCASAAAVVVNQTPVGQGFIALSLIEAAVGQVPGVSAVTVTFPAGTDRILVGAGSKPRVLDLTNDVVITFAGA